MSRVASKTRKSRQSRRSTRRDRAAKALAAGAALAAGTQAYASPIRFDNPSGAGHYSWNTTPNALDIRQARSAQPSAGGPSAIVQDESPPDYGQVFSSSAPIQAMLQVHDLSDNLLVGVAAGTLIPSGAPWALQGYSTYYGASFLPSGAPTYVGVEFNLGSGVQFGWIEVVRTGTHLDPLAWGYETTPGVPVPAGAASPEPGTLAMLAFGAAGLVAGRRRPCKPN